MENQETSMNKDGRPPALSVASGSPFWLCWTDNCRGNSDYGLYVIHAISDGGNRTLCGCKIQDFGERVTAANQPSCKRCQRILANNEGSREAR